ncbi:MAG: phytanoyl-CoA dioxygenase family protein, partial [Paenibacillus sp.]|nr:phytanoyl-CoA dioxygenase family protein [Paenibacillus sp.]
MSQLGSYCLSEEQKEQFHNEGYLIVKGLFRPEEVSDLQETFMRVHAEGGIPGHFEPLSEAEADGEPLKMYPRIIFPHRFIPTAKRYLLHPDVMGVLAELMEEEPLAAQSMFYFKPPGARGQALHQDNYYLRIEPGTCIAAWTAIDPSDEDNGGLVVVPHTQQLDIQCPHEADPKESYFRDEVELPEGSVIVPAKMEAGDVLFFNGSTIHGSYPNSSEDRF